MRRRGGQDRWETQWERRERDDELKERGEEDGESEEENVQEQKPVEQLMSHLVFFLECETMWCVSDACHCKGVFRHNAKQILEKDQLRTICKELYVAQNEAKTT